MYLQIKNSKGLSLVEVIVTAIIGVIVAAAILTFINITGNTTNEMAAMQVLMQESSMISEQFLRLVRRGTTVSTDNGTTPENGTLPAKHIKINYTDDSSIEFKITKNTFQIIEGDETRNISTRLCSADTLQSGFTIQPYGRGVTLTLALEYSTQKDTYIYTTTTGSVRCKNQ